MHEAMQTYCNRYAIPDTATSYQDRWYNYYTCTSHLLHKVCGCTFEDSIIIYISSSSEIQIFFTKETQNKCVYMRFSLPDADYITELPNSKEKNL